MTQESERRLIVVSNRLPVIVEATENDYSYEPSVGGLTTALEMLRQAQVQGDPFNIALIDLNMPGLDGEALGQKIKDDPALCDTVLIMLTLMVKGIDAFRLGGTCFSSYLTKPVKNSQLHDCLAKALGVTRALYEDPSEEGEAPSDKIDTLREAKRR